MGTQAGVGVSHHRNPKVAGREALTRAGQAGGFTQPDFTFMFAAVGYDQQALLASVREASGGAPLAGCSGEGIIAPREADESNFSVAVLALKSDELQLISGMAHGLGQDPVQAGREVGAAMLPALNGSTVGMFLLADGITLNFDRLMAGLQEALGPDRWLPAFGGAAADNMAMKRTYQYCDDEVVSDGVAWALLSGDARLAWGVNHGCSVVGHRQKVTRCSGNLIHEIDGYPAVQVLREYMVGEGQEAWNRHVINFCLGFRAPAYMDGYDEHIIRFIPASDFETGTVTIQTEVEPDADLWITHRDPEKLENGLRKIAADINAQLGGAAPKMVFQFDCVGRGSLFLREHDKLRMLEELQRAIGPQAPWIGFYTLGEIGPVGGRNCFHNYTAVILVIY